MSDILDDLRKVQRLRGDTYSSQEVVGMVGRAADEIEQLWKDNGYTANNELGKAQAEIERLNRENETLRNFLRGILNTAQTALFAGVPTGPQ